MAASKKTKKIKQAYNPSTDIKSEVNPDDFYNMFPSWRFADCDMTGKWSFSQERLYDDFWVKILPKLKSFESMTWGQILLDAKKNNHGISPGNLNKVAQNRLDSIHIEAADIYSLRLAATIRLYGYIVDNIFHIIWYDDKHGDNDTCVCRSNKKHT